MIQINLLPKEYQRRTKTPVKFVLAVAGATAVSGTLLAVWCWLAFGVAASAETEQLARQTEMDGLSPQIAYHEALEEETKIFASRERTLGEITKNRILWTEKMDQLIDVVNSSDEVDHFIWFDDINVRQVTSGRAKSRTYGTLQAAGHSGSEQFNQVANFMDSVEDDELTGFIMDFNEPKLPEGSINEREEGLIPSVNWSFPLSLSLRGPDERHAARAEATKKKISKGGKR